MERGVTDYVRAEGETVKRQVVSAKAGQEAQGHWDGQRAYRTWALLLPLGRSR